VNSEIIRIPPNESPDVRNAFMRISTMLGHEVLRKDDLTVVKGDSFTPAYTLLGSQTEPGFPEAITLGTYELLGRNAGDIDGVAIGTNEVVYRAAGNLDGLALSTNEIPYRGASNIAALAVAAETFIGRVTSGNIAAIAVADNTVVGRGGTSLGGIGIGTNELVGRAAGNVDGLAVAVETFVGRQTGGNIAAITVADNELVGRAGTALDGIAIAANTMVSRAAGNIQAMAVAVQSIPARAAGNLTTLAAAASTVLGRTASSDLAFMSMTELDATLSYSTVLSWFSALHLEQMPGSDTLVYNERATVWNEAGADIDLRMEGDTDANLFYLDASTNRIGIGTSTPAATLEVIGAIACAAINAVCFENVVVCHDDAVVFN